MWDLAAAPPLECVLWGRASDPSEPGMYERVGKWGTVFMTLAVKGNTERMIAGRDLFTRNLLFQAMGKLNQSDKKPK